jgi:hypothetical protein
MYVKKWSGGQKLKKNKIGGALERFLITLALSLIYRVEKINCKKIKIKIFKKYKKGIVVRTKIRTIIGPWSSVILRWINLNNE